MSRNPLRVLSCVIGLALGMTPAVRADSAGAPAAAAQKPAKRMLEKGMTADAVVKMIGQPKEVKELPSKDGKAETWIYRKQVGIRNIDIPNGQREVPVFMGMLSSGADSMKMTTEILYIKRRIAVYQVTSLLMFNGQLVLAKQTLEESENFE